MSGEPIGEDALLDEWDAYIGGRANGLDHLSRQDREVVKMLHSRALSPVPRAAFTSSLRKRLLASAAPSRRDGVGPGTPAQSTSVTTSPTAWRRRYRAVLAAALMIVLAASFGGRLGDDPPPTVQAPAAFAFTPVAPASPGVTDSCVEVGIYEDVIASAVVDPADPLSMTDMVAPIRATRFVTLQTIVADAPGPIVQGNTGSMYGGLVVDVVVAGVVTATFGDGAWATTVTGAGTSESRPVTGSMPLELVRGDLVVYPAGILREMSFEMFGRHLEIVRVVLHGSPGLPETDVAETATISTVTRSEVAPDIAAQWVDGLVVSVGSVYGRPQDASSLDGCAGPAGVVVDGLSETMEGGSTFLAGYLVRLGPLVLLPPV